MNQQSTTQWLTTYDSTRQAHAQGWSVVPLLGDINPDNGKSPAINWKTYQINRPSTQQINTWFTDNHSAYGIVCGSVSNLCVIDIDDLSLIDKLKKKLPFIFNTYTVRTGNRNGLHLYFNVDFKVYSRHLRGIDIKGEGGYVVGPGSTINGKIWECVDDRSPRRLTIAQWEHILATLKQPKTVFNDGMLRTKSVPNTATYKALYRNHIQDRGGRNNSLFMVAGFMRHDGYDVETCIKVLADCHANEPPWDGQHQELYAARYLAALATIRSAYKQQPRHKGTDRAGGQTETNQLSNTLREVLLQQPDGVAIARTIEGLQMSGVLAGTKLSLRQAVRVLKGVVGEHSVRRAFNALSADGLFIFPRRSPPDPPQANADRYSDIKTLLNYRKTVSQTVSLSGGKNHHTQKANTIIMPSIRHLCRMMGVEYTHLGTKLTIDDLKSPKAYRQALHVDLIKRCPGQYSQALLGARIGVSERTIRSYNKECAIRSQTMWYATPLHLFNVHLVPEKADFNMFGGLSIGGHWLQDETGKQYPPFREIVFALWRDGHRAFYCQQTTNYYWHEEFQQPAFTVESVRQPPLMPPPGEIPVKQSTLRILSINKPEAKPIPWYKQPLPNQEQEKLAEDIHIHIAKVSMSTARKIVAKHDRKSLRKVLQHVRYKIGEGSVHNPKAYFMQSVYNMQKEKGSQAMPRTYKRPLTNWGNEQAAQQLHTAIPDISIYNARRLVSSYGTKETKEAIRRVMWHNEKGKARTPAGLFITIIRQVWVEFNGGWHNLASPIPRFKGEKRRKKRKQ